MIYRFYFIAEIVAFLNDFTFVTIFENKNLCGVIPVTFSKEIYHKHYFFKIEVVNVENFGNAENPVYY